MLHNSRKQKHRNQFSKVYKKEKGPEDLFSSTIILICNKTRADKCKIQAAEVGSESEEKDLISKSVRALGK